MKRLDQAFNIGPKYAAEFEQVGIQTVADLANIDNPQDLSLRAGIPIELVRQWHERARQKIKTSRYRRRVAMGIAILALAVLSWLLVKYLRSPARISAQADAFFEKGDYERALARYNRVIQLDPQYKVAYANKGGALRRLGRTEEALAALNKALELDPEDVWAYDERGRVYSDRGEYERAVQDYDKATELNPDYKFSYAGKGYALEELHQYDEALAALSKAIELDPKFVGAYDERGDVYVDREDYRSAIQDYDKAIQFDPKYKYGYSGKGFSLNRLGQHEEGVAALSKALELDPKYAWAYAERGSIRHDHLFQFEETYKDLKMASDLAPGRVAYETDSAEAALSSGRFDEAHDLASKILAENENKDTKEFSVSSRMSMKFIVISALLLEGRTAEAKTKLNDFVSYYKSVPPNYKRDWNYSGTRKYIEGQTMDGPSKNAVLTLVKLLDRPPHSTIQRIEELASTLK